MTAPSPTSALPFPLRKPSEAFVPDAAQAQQAIAALFITWQFAQLDDAGLDAAIGAIMETDEGRHGAVRMIRDNAAAVPFFFRGTDLLMTMDDRLRESLDRLLEKMEICRNWLRLASR